MACTKRSKCALQKSKQANANREPRAHTHIKQTQQCSNKFGWWFYFDDAIVVAKSEQCVDEARSLPDAPLVCRWCFGSTRVCLKCVLQLTVYQSLRQNAMQTPFVLAMIFAALEFLDFAHSRDQIPDKIHGPKKKHGEKKTKTRVKKRCEKNKQKKDVLTWTWLL